MKNSMPIKITDGEWWFHGLFIQKQNHPHYNLMPYHIFMDTEIQETIGFCTTFKEAKEICKLNKNANYKYGCKSFLK